MKAVDAAVGVGRACGLAVERARILSDANNTLVHLGPAGVVAKVGTSAFRGVQLESLEREVAVAAFLAARGAPVIAPHADPGPHGWRDLTVTLWQYAEPARGEPLDAVAGLRAVHDALAAFPGELPWFGVELGDARRLLDPDRSPALAAGDRAFLRGVVDELQATLSGWHGPPRALHGSPHEGNWLRTAEGWRLLDFETACRGPLEWDLTTLDDADVDRFGDVDRDRLALLRRMRSACVAAKCWVDPDRAPAVREAAHVHLRRLRSWAAASAPPRR
jgi:hypothetical protein